MKRIIISLILLTLVLIAIFNIKYTSTSSIAIRPLSTKMTVKEIDNKYKGFVIYAEELIANSKEDTDIKNNTLHLQQYIDEVSNAGGGIVKLPAGTYYFASAGVQRASVSECVIKCKDNVIVEGSGTDERTGTILKPYAPSNYLPVDMFYYNNYAESRNDEVEGLDTTFLKNADFRNFVIDGEEAYATNYTSAGKGFMINLFENCDFENIIVKNTDGTGFGVDCPINCTIKNCVAINCGKGGAIHEAKYDTEAPGASGFGIGTGFCNEESMFITNCTAEGNFKYGFFFEHQGRFSGDYTASDAKGFVVANCIAKGNRFDFGGLRANDVTYENCISEIDEKNKTPINFGDMSRDIHMINCKVNRQFQDVKDISKYYYEAVYWALNSGITNGINKTEFSPNAITSREQAVVFLWRMAERPGDVVYRTGETLNKQFENIYTDVPSNASYVDAVKWAKEEGIVSASTAFSPYQGCTRAEFITMLWRYAGKPEVETNTNFTDVISGSFYENAVKWAVSKEIINGKPNDRFCPNDICTRAEIVTILYRFANKNDQFPITYNLAGGEVDVLNPTSYKVGSEITLNNPTREGYTFVGWTGSNYSQYVESNCYIPKLITKINSSDIGNRTYTANWVPNNYTLSFDSNDGTGEMDNQYFIYNDVPQKLLKNNFTRTGYIFNGWNTKADGTGKSFNDEEIIQNLTSKNDVIGVLHAQWIPIEVTYKVEHYKQNLNGKYLSIPSASQNFKAIAGEEVTPSTKKYAGYKSPTKQTVTVSADGTTVVKYYYTKTLIIPRIKMLNTY